jgi:hypothetical protein
MQDNLERLKDWYDIGPVQRAALTEYTEQIIQHCASICYKSNLEDSDAHAQNLLYEFNIDNVRDQK